MSEPTSNEIDIDTQSTRVGAPVGGTPDGMSPEDVDRRAELASFVSTTHFPVERQDLIDNALDRSAPDWVLGMLRRLPEERSFETFGEVWTSLGGPEEAHRF